MKKTVAFILVIVLCMFLYGCGEKAEPFGEFPVHVRVPDSWDSVNLWAWSSEDSKNAFEAWPGIAMTGSEDRWFTANAPEWVDALVISGNDGTVQTADIAIENRELWITVYEDLSYRLTYEKMDNIVVHAQIPGSWGSPGCWAWSMPEAEDAFAEWPGKEMTKNGEWYTIEVPAWINYIIINANAGSVQTADLPVDAGKDIWVVVENAENAKVFYEEPKADSVDTEKPKLSGDYHRNMSAVLDKEEFSAITANKAVTYWTEAEYMEEAEPFSGNYTMEYIPEELIAQTPEEVMYIVRCVYSEKYVANYELGGQAYRAVMDFEVFQRSTVKYVGYYEEPKLLAEATFEGGDPPRVIHDTNDHCGDRPDEAEIKQWISQVVQTANEQRKADALTQAKNTVAAGSFSHSGLVDSLTDVEIWGFTYEEATYAADNCGADWFAEAVEDAAFYISLGMEDKETLIILLEDAGFTHEQAVYGAENSGV